MRLIDESILFMVLCCFQGRCRIMQKEAKFVQSTSIAGGDAIASMGQK